MSIDILKDIELPEEVKAKIAETISSKYVAKEEFDSVLAKKEELLAEKKVISQKKKEADELAEKTRLEIAAKSGDIESLRASYEEKMSKLNEELNRYNSEKKNSSISAVAGEFVSTNVIEDTFVREAMMKEFASRLDLREEGLVVLDPKGNLTAMTLDDLKTEFLSNGKYSKHLIGSKASGGGTAKSFDKNSAPQKAKSLKDIPINDRTARMAAIKSILNGK